MKLLRALRTIARRGHRREEGQAAIEFMLMLPFFILFLLMAIDFGILMYNYVSVANAAREGARYGAVNCGGTGCDEGAIRNRAVERSGGMLSDEGDVTVSWPDGINRGDPVVVSISHSHTLVFFPWTFDVRACSDMRLEQRDTVASGGSGSGCSE